MKKALALCLIVPIGFLGCRSGEGFFLDDPYHPPEPPNPPIPATTQVPSFTCANGNGTDTGVGPQGLNFYNTSVQPSTTTWYNGFLQFSIQNTSHKTIRCCFGSGSPSVNTNAPNYPTAICTFARRACIELAPEGQGGSKADYGLACVAGFSMANLSIGFNNLNEVGELACSFPDDGAVTQARVGALNGRFTCDLGFGPI